MRSGRKFLIALRAVPLFPLCFIVRTLPLSRVFWQSRDATEGVHRSQGPQSPDIARSCFGNKKAPLLRGALLLTLPYGARLLFPPHPFEGVSVVLHGHELPVLGVALLPMPIAPLEL